MDAPSSDCARSRRGCGYVRNPGTHVPPLAQVSRRERSCNRPGCISGPRSQSNSRNRHRLSAGCLSDPIHLVELDYSSRSFSDSCLEARWEELLTGRPRIDLPIVRAYHLSPSRKHPSSAVSHGTEVRIETEMSQI